MRSLSVAYLDNAATSFPKPASVLREVNTCLSSYCGNPGRGSHALAMASAEIIYECRERLSDLLGLHAPENIIFTLNTTYALNLFIKGFLREGDHVLISDLEHNSVLRPIDALARAGMIEYDVFPSLCLDERRSPTRICAGIAKRLRPNTRLLLCTHASNICSYHLPLAEIGAFCHKNGIVFAVDAAQSAGHLPIDMGKMNIDALCAPAHKGLYGTQGCGFLALSPNLSLETIIEGGNGVHSLESIMPTEPPERFEAGTLPTPSIAALCRGVEYINIVGLGSIAEHEKALYHRLLALLTETKGFTVYAPEHSGAVLLFNLNGVPSEVVAGELGKRGICVRGGFHCSALGHKTLGTPEEGAVRASFGIFNCPRDVELLYAALRQIKSKLAPTT